MSRLRQRLIKAVGARLLREVNELDPGHVLRLAESYAKLAGQGSAVSAEDDVDAARLIVAFQDDIVDFCD